MTAGVLTVDDVVTRVQRIFGDESSAQVTQDDIIRWINDAQREAVMQNEGLLETVGYLDTVAGTQEYALPSDLFVLSHLYVKDGSSQSYYALKPLPLKEFTEFLDGWDGSLAQSYPLFYTKQKSNSIVLFPSPQATVAQGIKLIYSRYAVDVIDTTSAIDLPPFLHSYVVRFCLMQAYQMDEDWESAQQMASQVQGDLDFNSNRDFWFGRDSYPTISISAMDYEI